jgi:hypothetical protein
MLFNDLFIAFFLLALSFEERPKPLRALAAAYRMRRLRPTAPRVVTAAAS